jgi:urease accessory protein
MSSWIFWQLADSSFPAGGFAHSGGLEAAVQWGEVLDAKGLTEFVKVSLRQTALGVLPLIRASYLGVSFEALDWRCDAFLNNHVANRASRSQGHAFLSSSAKTFRRPELDRLQELVRGEKLPGHMPPVFGYVAAALKLRSGETTRLFLFMSLRSLISSAVRLNVVGPLQGQAIQHMLSVYAEEMAERYGDLDLEQIAQIAPVADLLQATHDRIYSKLFQS